MSSKPPSLNNVSSNQQPRYKPPPIVPLAAVTADNRFSQSISSFYANELPWTPPGHPISGSLLTKSYPCPNLLYDLPTATTAVPDIQCVPSLCAIRPEVNAASILNYLSFLLQSTAPVVQEDHQPSDQAYHYFPPELRLLFDPCVDLHSIPVRSIDQLASASSSLCADFAQCPSYPPQSIQGGKKPFKPIVRSTNVIVQLYDQNTSTTLQTLTLKQLLHLYLNKAFPALHSGLQHIQNTLQRRSNTDQQSPQYQTLSYLPQPLRSNMTQLISVLHPPTASTQIEQNMIASLVDGIEHHICNHSVRLSATAGIIHYIALFNASYTTQTDTSASHAAFHVASQASWPEGSQFGPKFLQTCVDTIVNSDPAMESSRVEINTLPSCVSHFTIASIVHPSLEFSAPLVFPFVSVSPFHATLLIDHKNGNQASLPSDMFTQNLQPRLPESLPSPSTAHSFLPPIPQTVLGFSIPMMRYSYSLSAFNSKPIVGMCILMRGVSGSGKSTLANSLFDSRSPSNTLMLSSDAFFMSDISVSNNQNGTTVVQPGYLWESSLLDVTHYLCRQKAHNFMAQAWKQFRSSHHLNSTTQSNDPHAFLHEVPLLIIDNTLLGGAQILDYALLCMLTGFVCCTLEPRTPWSVASYHVDHQQLLADNAHKSPDDLDAILTAHTHSVASALAERNTHGVDIDAIQFMLQKYAPIHSLQDALTHAMNVK